MTGFWKRLFAGVRRAAPAPSSPASAHVAELMEKLNAHALPCLRLVPASDGRSRLGGTPAMNGSWPRYRDRPLSLIAQLDLGEMHAVGGPDWLPAHGRLLLFYELEHGGWGFDPLDAGSAVVRWETGAETATTAPADLSEDYRFDPFPVTFVADTSFPGEDRLGFDWSSVPKAAHGELEAALDALTPTEPAHQVGGYPGPIQWDDMEFGCQLASNGIEQGKKADRAKIDALRPGAGDWRLFLQVDTDHEAGMMWGDTGRIYFWIRKQDARAADFSKVWMILQCH